jgi:hypothetical protein
MMNIKTDFDSSILRMNSPLFWFTLVIPIAIIGLGINFILDPVGASTRFGIPIHDLSLYVDQGNSRHLFGSRSPGVSLQGRPTHNRHNLRDFDFRPVLRRADHSEASWLCATHLYSLGNGALHDYRCRVSASAEGTLTHFKIVVC